MASEEDIKIAHYIISILKSDPVIILSWGIDPSSIKTVPGGIQFHVQGFIIKGTVKITYLEGPDLFRIEIKPDEPEPVIVFDGIYFDNLISTIDEAVEHTGDYEKRVFEECGII